MNVTQALSRVKSYLVPFTGKAVAEGMAPNPYQMHSLMGWQECQVWVDNMGEEFEIAHVPRTKSRKRGMTGNI